MPHQISLLPSHWHHRNISLVHFGFSNLLHQGPSIRNQVSSMLLQRIIESVKFILIAKYSNIFQLFPVHFPKCSLRHICIVITIAILHSETIQVFINLKVVSSAFLFHFIRSFHSPENQSLEFYIFKFHQMPKHKTRSTFYGITYRMASLCHIRKEKILSKNSVKTVT